MTPLKTFLNLSAEKQERIIRVAVSEFSEKGYEGASINAMVTRLGIAKGSMFQYFGDKKGLFLFVLARSLEMVKDYLRGVRDETAGEDLFFRLEKTLHSGVRFTIENPGVYRLYLRILSEARFPFREEILGSLREQSLEYIRGLIETAGDKGELREGIDVSKAAFLIDAAMDRFLQIRVNADLDAGLQIHTADEKATGEWITALVEMLRFGMGKDS